MGVVEGAKTSPPPLGTPSMGVATKNNDRLVLGERDAAIQDALDHGGAFIDLTPKCCGIYKQAILTRI